MPEPSEQTIEDRVQLLERTVSRLSEIIEPTVLIGKYAVPVAWPIFQELGHYRYSPKFFAMIDVGEALLKYSATIAFSHAASADPQMANQIFEKFRRPLTLGSIKAELHDLLQSQLASKWPTSAICDAYLQNNGKLKPAARYLFDEFINLRNIERGHGSQQSDGFYESLYLRHHVNVQDSVIASSHVELPLIHVDGMGVQDEGFRYDGKKLMGIAAIRLQPPILLGSRLVVSETYLWDGGMQTLGLSPFLTFTHCERCGQDHFFFLEKITDDKFHYVSPVGNHRIEKRRPA